MIEDLPLCRALLMNALPCPWVILVPRQSTLRELHDLLPEDQRQLMQEIVDMSKMISELWSPDKINVGALGNVVPQLHVHIVGRSQTDPAWPGPIWGKGPFAEYSEAQREETLARTRAWLRTRARG